MIFHSMVQERIFSRELVAGLSVESDPPWGELRHGKAITELWLSRLLRPYGIQPKAIRIGRAVAKGYLKEDFQDAFYRYMPRTEIKACLAEWEAPQA